MEKFNFLHLCKTHKLRLLFTATTIALLLSANICYSGIFVDLVHVDTAQYPLIRAYVRVIDENGNPITDLTESNFSILEDGNAQAPRIDSLFPPPIDPVAVALALDYSGSMVRENAIEDLETAALLFIELLRDDYEDACEIIKFSAIFRIEQAFTTDKNLLRLAVKRPWSEDPDYTVFYDAVYKAIEDTASYTASQGSLGSIVVASDGRDNASLHSLDDVISLAVSNEIPIFTVGLGEVTPPFLEALQRMAKDTDGSYFYAPTPSDLETIYFTIVTQHVGGYIVSYETSATGCQDHILEIGVTHTTGEANDSGSVTICTQSSGGEWIVRSGGGGCFVATAAYGSRMAKEVKVLERVRDEYLLTNELGRTFVSAYYKYSPPLANYIAKYPMMRKMVRVGLYPMLGLSKWLVGENSSE